MDEVQDLLKKAFLLSAEQGVLLDEVHFIYELKKDENGADDVNLIRQEFEISFIKKKSFAGMAE